MTQYLSRLGDRAEPLPAPLLCDAWTVEGRRFAGDSSLGADQDMLGRWPDDLETDAVVRLAEAVGECPSWEDMRDTFPVAQKLAERAKPQPLDIEILRHLRHLHHVCHRPRLHLRVEEERLPVARARRWPVRAVADLVSHPGDWEHRTLRSIQPSRILARLVEDEWNLYENRVAVRLVDHLLAYLAKRLEELRKIQEALLTGRDHSDEARTSFWRARRVMTLWADTLTTKTEDSVRATMQRLDLAHRDLQVLMDAPLYRHVPRRAAVPLSLMSTNILINDPHYRKVAALWRAWSKLGRRRQETNKQRAKRRQREGHAWDRFVLHLVVRAFAALGWTADREAAAWKLHRPGWRPVLLEVYDQGVVAVSTNGFSLRLLPVCAHLAGAAAPSTMAVLRAWDEADGEIVAAHVGAPVVLADADRASGWSFGGRATLFGCSPWGIDSEERMARLVNGWLNRHATGPYPLHAQVRGMPTLPREWTWVRCQREQLVAFRAPFSSEVQTARTWATRKIRELETKELRAKQAKQAYELAPRRAVETLREFIDTAVDELASLGRCPVCDDAGVVSPRPGRQDDGSDATWWATCSECDSEWGLQRCAGCGSRFRALLPQAGLDLQHAAASTDARDWPDKVLGRDVWAQPCGSASSARRFRCPECGR